jgi:hypothetical protein
MQTHRMWTRLARYFVRPSRPRTARPAVERLDDRIVPAKTTNWLGTNSTWGDPNNWDNGLPGAGDTAVLGSKPFTADPTVIGNVTGLGRLDATANFAGHTLAIGTAALGAGTLEVVGDGNGVSGSWAGGSISIADASLYSVQGGTDTFSDGHIFDSGALGAGFVYVGGGAGLVLGGTFSALSATVDVGFTTVGTNGTTGTLEANNNLSAPIDFGKDSGGHNHYLIVDGTGSKLNIDNPSQNNDMGIKSDSTGSYVLLQNDGQETIGAGAVIAHQGTPTLWSPAVGTNNHGYGNLDCEYTQATMHIQSRDSSSVALGDAGSTTGSSYTQAPGSTVLCDGRFALFKGTASFPSPSALTATTTLNATSVDFDANSAVIIGTAGSPQWVNLSISGHTDVSGQIYVSTSDGGAGNPPVGDTLNVSGTLDFHAGASFMINGILQWSGHGPWQFITATLVFGTVPRPTAVGNWQPTWIIAGIGAGGVGASW